MVRHQASGIFCSRSETPERSLNSKEAETSGEALESSPSHPQQQPHIQQPLPQTVQREWGTSALQPRQTGIHEQQLEDCVPSNTSRDRTPSVPWGSALRTLSWCKWVPSHLVLLRKNYQVTEAEIYKSQGTIHSPL